MIILFEGKISQLENEWKISKFKNVSSYKRNKIIHTSVIYRRALVLNFSYVNHWICKKR